MKKDEIVFVVDKLNHSNVMFGKLLIGEIYPEVDGYYVFLPIKEGGYWSGWVLKTIYNKLEELNKAWDVHLTQVFSKGVKPRPPWFDDYSFESTKRVWSGGFRGYKK